MKVGTDGVLLGAWVPLQPADRRLLDIGTGTGLIALMLAQRHPEARVTAVDIDPRCAAQARQNADASPWGARISVSCSPVQEYLPDGAADGFDLIVSNPPYYDDSLLPPDAGRTTARHAVSLRSDELLAAVDRLLAPCGRFALILPSDAADRFCREAALAFRLTARTDVHTTPASGPRRSLLHLVRAAGEADASQAEAAVRQLVIQTAPGCYTSEYRALTADFYLKF